MTLTVDLKNGRISNVNMPTESAYVTSYYKSIEKNIVLPI